MAALGFSVLMREWRRGTAFDPWHGSLYLSLSTVITLLLSPRLSVFLVVMEKQTCTAGFDQISQAHAAPADAAHTRAITQEDRTPPPPPSRHLETYRYGSITCPGDKKKKAQKQICENIILFAELHDERASVIMLRFHIICLSKPHNSPMGL